MERIIDASSNEGDVVLDPFCGCGTAIAVAQRLKRRWVGIDITHLAVNLMKHRLLSTFGESIKSEYQVIGEPTDVEGARQLAQDDPYQFQWWALGLVGARPVEQKKGADKGMTGASSSTRAIPPTSSKSSCRSRLGRTFTATSSTSCAASWSARARPSACSSPWRMQRSRCARKRRRRALSVALGRPRPTAASDRARATGGQAHRRAAHGAGGADVQESAAPG